MKKIAHSLLMAASLLLVFACSLNTDGKGSGPKSVDVALSCSAGPERGPGARGLIDDAAVLSVTVTATDSGGTTIGGPLTLTKGGEAWTGSMSLAITGHMLVTFKAIGWSGAGGTGNVLYYGESGIILTEANDGIQISIGTSSQMRTWTEQTSPGSPQYWASIASSGDSGYLAAAAYYIFTSTDKGVTWTEQDAADKRSFSSITSSSDGAKLAAIDQGESLILTSADSGATWAVHADVGGNYTLTAIASSSDGAKLAAVENPGNIYTSTDSGATWTNRGGGAGCSWTAIASSSNGTMLAAALSSDCIYTSTDSGATWTRQEDSGTRAWTSIASSFNGSVLLAAASGDCLCLSTDSGASWKEVTAPGVRDWRGVALSADGSKMAAVSDSGYIFTSTATGSVWTEQTGSGSRSWRGIVFFGDMNGIAAVDYFGYIYTSELSEM